MLHKTSGIVLHQLKYGDTSLIVTMYTSLTGRGSFLIQGVHGKKSRFPASLFQPLTLLNLQTDVKPKRDLQRITEITLLQPFHSIPFDTSKSVITLFLAEILYRTIREEEANPALFSFLIHSIQLLDVAETGIANFHLVFLMNLSKHLGFYPTDNYSETCFLFDTLNGRFVSPDPQNNANDKMLGSLVHKLLNSSFQTMHALEMNHQNRLLVIQTLIDYYNLHLGGIGEIKSLSVLHSIYDD